MADVTVAISRKATTRVLHGLTNRAAAAGTTTSSTPINDSVTVDIVAAWRVPEDYTVTFDDDPDAIRINELDIVIDRLDLTFRVNLPTITVGGNCLARHPVSGACLAQLPVFPLFQAATDFTIPVSLTGFRAEVSGELDLNLVHFSAADADALSVAARAFRENLVSNLAQQLAPDTPPEILDFFRMALVDGWELRAEPHWIDVDPFDVPDAAAASFNAQLTNAINGFGASLPATTRAALAAVVGNIGDFIRAVLDLPDDLQEFLLNLITSIGLVDQILELLSNQFGFLYILKVPDEPEFDISPDIPPVAVRVTNAALNIEPEELSIDIDIDVPAD
jgi:hypothetical protein